MPNADGVSYGRRRKVMGDECMRESKAHKVVYGIAR